MQELEIRQRKAQLFHSVEMTEQHERGLMIGAKRGMIEGEKKGLLTAARSLKAVGVMSVADIAKTLGLSQNEVEAL